MRHLGNYNNLSLHIADQQIQMYESERDKPQISFTCCFTINFLIQGVSQTIYENKRLQC